jgi:transposase
MDMERITPQEPKFLPVISELTRQFQMEDIIDKALDCRMEVSPGLVVVAMILDTFSGRSPLYRMERTWANQDAEILLGSDLCAEKLTDDTLGRVLDRMYEYGTSKLLSSISFGMLKKYEIVRSGLWHDTTSVSVWGAYEGEEGDPFNITKGFNKDHRPDLKQFVLSLLCTDHGFPVRFTCEDGNASDKTINNSILKRVGDFLKEYKIEEDYVFVADSSFVTEGNLALTQNPYVPFITRLPRTYKECHRVIAEAIERDDWQEIGVLAETVPAGKQRPATYKAYEGVTELYGRTYRATVIHSDALDKRKQKKLSKRIEESRVQSEKMKRALERQEFYCRPDAQAVLDRAGCIGYHQFTGKVVEKAKYGKGRPPKNGKRKPKAIRYKLKLGLGENPEAVKRASLEAGCFVLLSNVPLEGEKKKEARSLLSCYKQQHHVEQNFGFLKDPLIVNDLFLKKPSRIEALGLILVLCVMLWRLVEYLLRQRIKQRGEVVEGWDRRPTTRPTTFMAATKFNVLTVKIGEKRLLGRKLSQAQRKYLELLDMNEDIFLVPRELRRRGPG